MSVGMIVLVVLGLLVILLAIKTPIALALGISGAVGLVTLRGFGYTESVLGSVPYSTVASFGLTIIPMFILMGLFAVRARVAESVFAVANHFLGRLPGGLGIATVMACAGFAAVSGSSIGTAATMSKLSVNEMRTHGYPASLATALVAIAGTLGVMIPPSTFLVLYAIMTQTSVSQMLAAGFLPGILSAVAFSAYVIVFGSRKITKPAPNLATAVQDASTPSAPSTGQRGRARDLPWRGVLYLGILFTVVIGGMFSGIFTPTESAALGAVASMVILVVEKSRGGLRKLVTEFKDALLDTAGTTSMVFFIIVGSAILSNFFSSARVPAMLTSFIADLPFPPMLVMALLLLCLIPLGMVLESLSILVITVPILLPIAVEFGFNPIWLGIMVVKLIEIGMVTPPVGINCFVVAGATKIKTETVFAGVLPLVVVDLVVVAILFFVPDIALFLPSLDANA